MPFGAAHTYIADIGESPPDICSVELIFFVRKESVACVADGIIRATATFWRRNLKYERRTESR